MERTNTTEEPQFQIIEKVPEEVLRIALKQYAKYCDIEAYVKIPFVLIGILFLIHNVFIAGNTYDYETYENIKTTEFSIVGIIISVVFVLAGIAISLNSKMTKNLKEISKRYNIKTEIVQDEFNALGIHMYGGRGVQLKKK